MEDVPKIKGAAFREFVLWYEGAHGSESLHRVLRALSKEERQGLRPDAPGLGILASGWYAAPLAHVLLDAVCEGRGEEERRGIARDGSRAVLGTMLDGVYRFLFERVSTPERYSKHIDRLWRQLHSTGTRRIALVGPNEADSTIEDWPGHHPLLCLITMETMAAVFEVMRCRDVRLERVACISSGDPACRARLQWKDPI